jgi:hypothetical protein
MAGVRFAALQSRPMEFLDFTSVTLEEFQQLVPPLRGGVPRPDGGVADGWQAADRASVYRVQKLPPADAGRSVVLHSGLPENLCPPGGPGAPVRDGAGQSQSVDPRALARAARGPAHPR